MEALVQHPDNHTRDHRPEDPGINRLDTDHALNVVGFKYGSVGGRQNAFRGQPEVNRQVHHGVAHKPGKRRDAFVLARQAQRDSDTEHDGQEAKRKGANFTHPDEDRLQHRGTEERDQRDDVFTAQRAADPEHDPAEREECHGQHKGFTQLLEKFPQRYFLCCFRRHKTTPLLLKSVCLLQCCEKIKRFIKV